MAPNAGQVHERPKRLKTEKPRDQETENEENNAPKGEYAETRTPLAWQYSTNSNCGRQGFTWIWFVAGTTVQCGSRTERVLMEKLEMPMDLTLPDDREGFV